MKTPHDILFARHQAAAPRLDAVRREVVNVAADVNRRKPVREFTFAAALAKAVAIPFQELIWPCRRIWTGLAAIWILIFVVNFSLRDDAGSGAGKSVPSAEIIMSLQVQQRWMNELFADRLAPPDADRRRNFMPKPRSEKFQTASV
jgi:hypothetical protein